MLQSLADGIGKSRITAAVVRRPRLMLTLVLLVALVAMQGGAVALDGVDSTFDWGATTQDGKTTDMGP